MRLHKEYTADFLNVAVRDLRGCKITKLNSYVINVAEQLGS